MPDTMHYQRFQLPATKSPIDARTQSHYTVEWTHAVDVQDEMIIELAIGGRHVILTRQEMRVLKQLLIYIDNRQGGGRGGSNKLPIQPIESR